MFDQGGEAVGGGGMHDVEFHRDVAGACEVDEPGPEFFDGDFEGGRRGGVWREGRDCDAEERRGVVAAGGDGFDQGRELHAVGSGEVDDVDDREGVGGVGDGGVGGGESESVARGEVDEGG